MKVHMLILNEKNLPLKSLQNAKDILLQVRKQNATLLIESEKAEIHFNADTDEHFLITEYPFQSTIPREFHVTMQITNEDAVKKLYKYRKYFNNKWA